MHQHTLLTIVYLLNVFLVNNSYAYEMSLILLDKLFQNGTKLCKKAGLGNYLITDNPFKLIDISNDGIKDLIIDTSKQRCEQSFSYFAGGTGGNDFIFFINLGNIFFTFTKVTNVPFYYVNIGF